MPVEGRGLSSRAALEGEQDMGTGESLSAPERVQRLRTALHAKAKGSPGFRFYSLCDKVWRADVLAAAWQAVRRNGGAGGVDGETVADIETYGVSRWLGELAWDLKAGTYRPDAVRRVLIPKKRCRGDVPNRWAFRCIRDRVAQTAAMLVLSPIIEADQARGAYTYRTGGAVRPMPAVEGVTSGQCCPATSRCIQGWRPRRITLASNLHAESAAMVLRSSRD